MLVVNSLSGRTYANQFLRRPPFRRSATMSNANPSTTPEIEKKYVHRVYDAIAPHFSATRFAKWPKVARFIGSLAPGSVILDVGCGNGKYLGLNSDCVYVGCDISPPLIEICSTKGHEVAVADCVNLPYRSGFGDAAISIAVLHHLSSEIRRRKAIEELVRVVRKGGRVLITVWAVEQENGSLLKKWTPLCPKYDEAWVSSHSVEVREPSLVPLDPIPEENGYNKIESHVETAADSSTMQDTVCTSVKESESETHQEYFVPWHLPFHRAEIVSSSTAVSNGFAKKDNKKGALVYNRYYHVFMEGELQRLVAGISNTNILDQFYDKSNWCIILEKI